MLSSLYDATESTPPVYQGNVGLGHPAYEQGKLVGTKESPISVELDSLDKAQSHLAENLSLLVGRLSPVRNSSPRNEATQNGASVPPRSPLADRINTAKDRADNMCRTVDDLLSELEV